MNTRTPTTHPESHSHLRVLDGGLSAAGWQEDEPAGLLDPAWLADQLAEAARLCDDLDHAGLRVTFAADPAGGRVRAFVTDDAGLRAEELALVDAVSPTNIRMSGAAG